MFPLLIGDEFSESEISEIIQNAFIFSAPLKIITENIAALELFHGPTLAFKDFGARFMAQILAKINQDSSQPLTILTATSGDTGAAVAHAFMTFHLFRLSSCILKIAFQTYRKNYFAL